jgi:glycosyltransferase involved in cell wall biosynthesis
LTVRIAQVTSFFNPLFYKSNEYFIAAEMTKLGHEVLIFCPKKDPAWQSTKGQTVFLDIEELDGFTVKRIPGDPVLFNMPTMPALLHLLECDKFDLIHSHEFFSFCSLHGAIASKKKGIPLIITQHNDSLPDSPLNRLGYQVDAHTIGKLSYCQASKVIVLSNDGKRHLIEMGLKDEKVEVIPNAVDSRLFKPTCENLLETKYGISQPVILFIGRLVPEKGVQFLIPAFTEVVKQIHDAKLVIVGSGPWQSKLKKMGKSLLGKQICFIEKIENKMMPNVYVGCNVLVAPSLKEPFGNVVLEAMSSGKPVIGSYVGGIKDTIINGQTGYHVAPGDVRSLSNYMIKLLKDDVLCKELGRNSRLRVVCCYDSKVVAKKIEETYTDAICRSRLS